MTVTPSRRMPHESNMSRILLIDDDPAVRDTIASILTAAGYGVTTAPGGRAGLDAIDAGGIDLVITDLLMPDMEGLETIRMLRQRAPEVPVIAISGGGSLRPEGGVDYLATAAKFGAAGILRKPFGMRALLDQVGAALGAPART